MIDEAPLPAADAVERRVVALGRSCAGVALVMLGVAWATHGNTPPDPWRIPRVMFAVSGALLVVSVGLLRRREWARQGLIVLVAGGIVGLGALLVGHPVINAQWKRQIQLVVLMVALVGLIRTLRADDVRALFRAAPPASS